MVMSCRGLFALGLVLLFSLPPVQSAGDTLCPDAMRSSARADEPWWDGAWQCRVPVRLDNSNNTADLYDYQVYLEIPYDSDMRSDFSDLRFVHYLNGSQLGLTYWFESIETGKLAKAWVHLTYL